MSGFIKLHRGWRDTDGLLPSKDFSDFEAWLWIIENAAWKDGHRFNAKGEMVPIGRGQMHVSIRSLQTTFGWSKTRVERFLVRLKTVTKVTLEAGQYGTILTICNYERYQGCNDSDKPSRGTVASPAAGQTRDTHKEGEEREEQKNEAKASNACKRADVFPCPDGVDPIDWEGLKANRKAKRAALTEGAYRQITGKLERWHLAGWPPGPVVAYAVERGWTTVFETDEMKGQVNGAANRAGTQQRDGRSSLARAIDEGLDWIDGTQARVS